MEIALFEHNKIREKHLNTASLKLTKDFASDAKKYAEELSLVSVSFGLDSRILTFQSSAMIQIGNHKKGYAWNALWLKLDINSPRLRRKYLFWETRKPESCNFECNPSLV